MRKSRRLVTQPHEPRWLWLSRRVVRAWLAGMVLVAAACAVQKSPAPRPMAEARGNGSTTGVATASSSPSGGHPAGGAPQGQEAQRPEWSLVVEPNDGMGPIDSLMSSAQHSLDMTMYELADPEAVSILEGDAARGVRVRVLLDQDYSGASVNADAYSELSSHGVEVRWANSGTIFHQKTITVDDSVSAIMTLNLTSDDYTTTRDFAVITDESSDVSAIESVFEEDWGSTGPPASSSAGDGLVWSPGATEALVNVIDSAQHSLVVENEEMDDSVIEGALESAASRGVTVDVVMTADSDWDSAFAALSAAGVHIALYPDTSSALYIHAKVIVADGTTAFIGSENFSESSLEYNRELGLITTVPVIVNGISQVVEDDYARGTTYTASKASQAAPAGASAWCQVTASPSDDGYSGDYNLSVTSNQPDAKATASDSTDSWSDDTSSSGSVVIVLYHTEPGETITVTVGSASCTTTA